MRKITNFKTMFVAVVLLITNISVNAQLLTEDFNYTLGTKLSANGWTAHSGSGTNSETVTASTISYSGYASSGIGGEVILATSGEDVNKAFTSQNSGSIYASFLVNVTSATTTGDYIAHFAATSGASVTSFGARLFIKLATGTGATNFAFGIGKSSTAANTNYTAYNYTIGTTYLVVIKYSFESGTFNDDCALFVNPTLSSNEPLPTVATSIIDNATADVAAIVSFCLRQGGSTSAPVAKVDGIRVSTLWSDLVGTTASVAATAPVFSIGAGTYTSSQSVSLSSTTGTSIYYTTDGSTPDNTKTLYTNSINVNATTTIKAIAYASGLDPSPVIVSIYTLPAISVVESSVPTMVANVGSTDTKTINVSGSNLAANISTSITGTDLSLFTVLPTSLTPTSGSVASTPLVIKYTPVATGNHTATLTLSSAGAIDKVFTLNGTCSGYTNLNSVVTKLDISTSNGKITLSASANQTIEIYNSVGQKLFSKKAIEGVNSIPVSARGVVLVKVDNKIAKVIL